MAVLDVAATASALVVDVHDLLSERSGPVRTGALLGAALAESGVTCLRFDAGGAGDSSGRLRDCTWSGMTNEVVAMTAWALDQVGQLPVVLVGHGIGAVPVTQAAPLVPGCVGMVLVDADLLQDVRYVVGRSFATKRGKWHLPDRFFREREGIRPRTDAEEGRAPAVLVYGEQDEKASATAAVLTGTTVRTAALPGGLPFREGGAVDHVVREVHRLLAAPSAATVAASSSAPRFGSTSS